MGRAVRQAHGIEVVGDLGQHTLVGRIDQPHHQKKRHHGGHEVGVGYFPDAAVMAPFFGRRAPANENQLMRVGIFVACFHRVASSSFAIQPLSRVSSTAGPATMRTSQSSLGV